MSRLKPFSDGAFNVTSPTDFVKSVAGREISSDHFKSVLKFIHSV